VKRIINPVDESSVADDLWTKAIWGFYLFLLESHIVMLTAYLLDTERQSPWEYPNILTSLDDSRHLVKQNLKNLQGLALTMSIIFNTDYFSLYNFKSILENILPKSYEMLKPLYDPLLDIPVTINGKLTINSNLVKIL